MKKTLLFLAAFLIAAISSNVFAKTSDDIQWPDTIQEWYVGMPHIEYQQIVYHEVALYQCITAEGTDAFSDGWSPTGWNSTNYNKIADARTWEVGMSDIAYQEYVIWEKALYQCTATEGTSAYSDGWSPTGWNSTNYNKICGMKLIDKTVEVDWEAVDEAGGVWEWGLHLNMIYFEDIVIFRGVMYQCTAAEGTYAYTYPWNPTAWEAPRYQEVAPVAAWETGTDYTADEYVTYGDALYRVLNTITASATPDTDTTNYERLTDVTWGPEIVYPDNYVSIWNDYVSFSVGAVVIYEIDENVYKCIQKTDVEGGQIPGTVESEYWSESLGLVKNILTLSGVTIPDWDDTRIWTIGSIVKYNDKYYKAINQTHIGNEEFPDVTGSAAYWSELVFNDYNNLLPRNYVGYWNTGIVWLPKVKNIEGGDSISGYFAIYEGKVVECRAKTTPGNPENPASIWGHWYNGTETNWPGPEGDEADLLNLPRVVIPTWSDNNWWPVGAVVVYNDVNYKCIQKTDLGAGQTPENTDYWEVLILSNGLNEIPAGNLMYYVNNGQFVVDTNSTNISIGLYSITGQSLATTYANHIELPQTGLYIVKVTIDGKTSAIKLNR